MGGKRIPVGKPEARVESPGLRRLRRKRQACPGQESFLSGGNDSVELGRWPEAGDAGKTNNRSSLTRKAEGGRRPGSSGKKILVAPTRSSQGRDYLRASDLTRSHDPAMLSPPPAGILPGDSLSPFGASRQRPPAWKIPCAL